MAPFGKIYTYPNNLRVLRVQVIAEMNGLEIEVPNFVTRKDNRTPEYLAKFPLGKVPTFEGADGFCLSESIAIATYVAQSGPAAGQILGTDPKTQALILKWALFSETELFVPLFGQLGMTIVDIFPRDEKQFNLHVAAFERAINSLEASLTTGQKFLVGDELTLADLAVGSNLFYSFKFVIGAEWHKQLPKLAAYAQAFADIPAIKKRFGELEFGETRVNFHEPKY